jgi:putative flippase GtrA
MPGFRSKLQRVFARFARASVVGIIASVADIGSLTLMIEVFGLRDVIANWPSLFLGISVQFIGAKYAVFRAHRGSWVRHIGGFVAVEVGAYILNGLAFHFLVTLTPIPYIIARILGTLTVFLVFSYPIWHWVFKDGAELRGDAEEDTEEDQAEEPQDLGEDEQGEDSRKEPQDAERPSARSEIG